MYRKDKTKKHLKSNVLSIKLWTNINTYNKDILQQGYLITAPVLT